MHRHEYHHATSLYKHEMLVPFYNTIIRVYGVYKKMTNNGMLQIIWHIQVPTPYIYTEPGHSQCCGNIGLNTTQCRPINSHIADWYIGHVWIHSSVAINDFMSPYVIPINHLDKICIFYIAMGVSPEPFPKIEITARMQGMLTHQVLLNEMVDILKAIFIKSKEVSVFIRISMT